MTIAQLNTAIVESATRCVQKRLLCNKKRVGNAAWEKQQVLYGDRVSRLLHQLRTYAASVFSAARVRHTCTPIASISIRRTLPSNCTRPQRLLTDEPRAGAQKMNEPAQIYKVVAHANTDLADDDIIELFSSFCVLSPFIP